jgi:hypothetical protein
MLPRISAFHLRRRIVAVGKCVAVDTCLFCCRADILEFYFFIQDESVR